MTISSLIKRDLAHIWHPCSQMKDYENFAPLIIKSAQGAYIELADGTHIIDAISSWWCKSLGHNHPHLKAALIKQAEQFEHVITANTVNETLVRVSEKLAGLEPHLNKVFYASDGCCAVEIALKMSLHARAIQNQPNKQGFIALQNGYHGETFGALSVSDLGLYRKPYESHLSQSHFLSPIPYVTGIDDPLWHNCESYWQQVLPQLERLAKTTTAIIIEPLIQGAAGMKIYSLDFLKRLYAFTREHDIHLIADEIMTGLGRTGKYFAFQHGQIAPDFVCLSKGLTGGYLAFSAVLTTRQIYNLFYDDYETGKGFLHSHTFSGNALGAAVSLAMFEIMEKEQINEKVAILGNKMKELFIDVANETNVLKNLRQFGGIVAADLDIDACLKKNSKLNPHRLGYQIFQTATKYGALLRPIGNTLYWLPPLNIEMHTLEKLKNITMEAIQKTIG